MMVCAPVNGRTPAETNPTLDATNLLPRGQAIESELMDLVWKTGDPMQEEEEAVDDENEKKPPRVTAAEVDEESGEYVPEKRDTNLMNTILVAFTLCLIIIMLGAGFRQIAIEVSVDSNYIRLAFLALTPIQVFFTLVSSPLSWFADCR